MQNIAENFREELENNTRAEFSEIESRKCTSEGHRGIEYSFSGRYIPIIPIVELVATKDDAYIQSMSQLEDSTDNNNTETKLFVFVVGRQTSKIEDAFV